jgi:uncharacterized membrane protein
MKAEGVCRVCGNRFSESELIAGHGIRHQIETLIQADFPDWSDRDSICKADFDAYRIKYINAVMEDEKGEFKNLESDVVRSIRENEIITSDINTSISEKLTVGERISDEVARFGGSWAFIITFFSVLVLWIALNSFIVLKHPFDPYPFILLNLILSCIAAIQAPIIMMSQNRQEKKDRLRSENDYKVNLKSELEIRTLHEKVDHLLLVQWSKLMEVQDLQIEILEDIKSDIKRGSVQ